MKMADTSQAAESTAAMLRTIPGALRGPKIAAMATNATAAMMKMEDCMESIGDKWIFRHFICEGIKPIVPLSICDTDGESASLVACADNSNSPLALSLKVPVELLKSHLDVWASNLLCCGLYGTP